MNEAQPIEQLSDSGSKISARNSSFFVILSISLVVALISYGVQQYSLQKDIAEGTEKRLKAELEQGHSDEASVAERKYVEQQRLLAKSLTDSLMKNPQDTSLLLPLSTARVASGDTLGALQALEKYVSVNPNHLGAQTDYAYVLFISGRVKEGQDLTLKVLDRDPKNQIALFNMAAMCFKQGNLKDTEQWMHKCVAADSTTVVGGMALRALAELQRESSHSESGTKSGQ